jgi:fructose-1,6-bisphosphatase-3
MSAPDAALTDADVTALRPLQRLVPTLDAALAECARLSAELTLPKGTIHVISDVHGDDVKLRHVINNASGQLRPLVRHLFADRLDARELQDLLTLIFYPREALALQAPKLADRAAQNRHCQRVLRQLFEVVRVLARRYTLERGSRVFPAEYHNLFQELLHEPSGERGPAYYDALIGSLVDHGRALHFVHLTVRVVRNLAIEELVLAGDCWDRGPRGDRVVEYLQKQPNVAFVWGNHDAAWLGACLGQEACIAHVLRISCRYCCLQQLEEGYGVPLEPLEHLARTVYGDDPAECFTPKGLGLRDPLMLARMQKAAAVMQFKLEGQTIDRRPEWGLAHRKLLHTIDRAAGTVSIDGKSHPLRDARLPTLDAARPYELSPEERACLDRLAASFQASEKLWGQMKYLLEIGGMYLVRDANLIFHGCVPVDDKGRFLPLVVDGQPHSGRALFDALDRVLARSLDQPTDYERDVMWYLWCGPLSPLFGKDRIATFEIDFIASPATHVETKSPYFQLVNDPAFCDSVLREFGVDVKRGLIVNGHVPVKIEKGESPLKRSGKAITIDGAFSEAYGDHGYTLVLGPGEALLAKHHHFDSVEAAVQDGLDIVPEVTVIRQEERPRTVADTERGDEVRRALAWLERLTLAYRTNRLRQAVT